MRQPSPSRVAVVVGARGSAPDFDERGGEQHVAARDLREHRLLRVGAELRDRQRARDERRDHRQRRDEAADLAQEHAEVEEAEAEPAGRLGQRDAEQVRLRELGPRVAVVPVVGAVAFLQVLEPGAVLEDPRREPAQLLLRLR